MVDLHLLLVLVMYLKLEMIDIDTGEIIVHSFDNLACNIDNKNDVGVSKINAWVASCIRGVRFTDHSSIELRIAFSIEKDSLLFNFEV